MLKKLQQRWKVNSFNLILIIATFAIGGSLCGWAGRKILLFAGLEKGVVWIITYILIITLLWPICVLIISIPLGQFRFFKNYILRVYRKMSGKRDPGTVTRIAIFASGTGSNAKKIIEYFSDTKRKERAIVCLIVCNNPGAGVLQIAKEYGIPTLIIEKEKFFKGTAYLDELKKHGINFIVLAGFLWKLPAMLLNAYPKRVLNIHPALLPGYGGKGMYGNHVHEAVISNKEKESGITIHFADELYDHGEIVSQVTCEIESTDNAASLAQKIHVLEHEHYPRVIDELLQKQNPR